ncbi:MAG: methionyl-tRNA formyltransferase [Phycisphaerales bacterium]|nr:methionyl-tRNA formyltransferase [Phycisphaerales bacterium]
MRLVLLGSGAFALPTFRQLANEHEVALVVSQPDRPAGRHRTLTPTPVAQWAIKADLPLLRVDDINSKDVSAQMRSQDADAWVVIAFGQKLSEDLLSSQFAINLHGSLLPRWRGASPIHHAILAGDTESGVSVITLASHMDGGDILGSQAVPIKPGTTAGQLHDELSLLGPALVIDVLQSFQSGTLKPTVQDPSAVTQAAKLSRRDARLCLNEAAAAIRQINGLSPWPGVDAIIDGQRVRLASAMPCSEAGIPGMVSLSGCVGCQSGSFSLVNIQPPGKRVMTFSEWANGRRLEQPVTFEVDEASP